VSRNRREEEEEGEKAALLPSSPVLAKASTIRLVDREGEKILNSFCRVSLANSKENVLEGIGRICDFMDELR